MNEFAQLVGRQLAADLRALPARVRARLSGEARLARCRNIADLRALARRVVPGAVFDFVDGAANDEVTARRNQADFAALEIHPRVLVDVERVDLSTTVLGQRVALPLLGAPTGLTGLIHHRGEAAIAHAVQAAGSIYVLSAMASYSIEEIAREAPGPTWFQLYVWRDRGLVRELVARARAAGHGALVLTVDVPRAAVRERDLRNGFGIPPRLTLRSLGQGLVRPRWSAGFVRHPRMSVANATGRRGGASDAVSLSEYINSQFDPRLSWRDVAWLREEWSGPLLIKGILHPEDAARAASLGADGLIVSNHGGRQLDHAPSTISVLPRVVDAVAGRAEVLLDGGVRRGADVLKARALGARACLVGRPLVYGLGAGGDRGAARTMAILRDELGVAMALAGCASVASLDAGRLVGSPAGSPASLEPTGGPS